MNAVAEIIERQPRSIIDLDKAQLALEERAMRWRANRHLLQPIVEELEPLCVSVSYPGSLDFSMTGDKEVLLRAVRLFRKQRFSSTGDRPKKGDSSWSAFFHRPGCAISLWLHFTSTVCRRVKVGTKMVEQDVYETVCGAGMPESSELLEAAPPAAQVSFDDDIPF